MKAAKLLLLGMDFRDVGDDEPHSLQKLFWARCLPCASQTQFVERGVKLCNVVAETDQGEESRMACAICTSANVHSCVDRKASNEHEIKAPFQSSQALVD